jgi:HlyD family secretion protein
MGMPIKRNWILVAGLFALVAIVVTLRLNQKTPAEYFTAIVEKGDIDEVVDVTGTINAVITVQVGSQVSGTIAKLNADFNSRVHKGEVVALIDPALFKGALDQATADLDNAKANVAAAKANVEKTRSAAVQAKADYDRAAQLAKANITSQQQLDLAKANLDAANATVDGALANVTQAQAQVTQRAAAVSVAQINLNYTVIRSPIDGTVVARNVDVGQTVAASLQAPTIFTIAQDLSKMWVYAKTDESDVGNIRLGKPVTFKVDAFPKDVFRGVVSQVRMNPTTVLSVVTYDTIIEFANPELKLFPGMTAFVTIPVNTVQNVLKIQNTALRYKPPMTTAEILAIYKQYGIQAGEEQGTAENRSAGSESGANAGSGVQSNPRARKMETAVIWKHHADNAVEPIKISLGITDHAFTEVTGVLTGQLHEGDQVIIRSVVAGAKGAN